MSTLIRTAVIGYGLAGKVFHAPFVAAVPGLELTAVVQRTGDEAAQAFPATRILRSADDAINDPAIDLIVVGTPNNTHFDLAKQALQANKHVVIDKPFASSSAECRELIDLAAITGKIVAPFHNRRYDGDFLTVQKLLADRTLGRVVTIESRFDRYRPQQRLDTWKESAGHMNGLLFDLGPHLVDQALALFGPPARITASVRTDRDSSLIEDAFDITLAYGGKGAEPLLRYHCHATMLAADSGPRFIVHGTHGSYRKFGVDPQEPAILAGARPPRMGSSTPWLTESEDAYGTLTLATLMSEPVKTETTRLPTVPGDYRNFYANVRDAIQGTAPLAIPAEDAYTTIRLLELARESSEEGVTLHLHT